jgi:hypothetical protein
MAVITAAAVAAVVTTAPHGASAGEGRQDGHAATSPQPQGMRAYIDPETGEIAVPPPGAVQPQAPVMKRRKPLVEVTNPSPAGGAMINTKGRFLAGVTATTDPQSNLSAHCTSSAPALGARGPRP